MAELVTVETRSNLSRRAFMSTVTGMLVTSQSVFAQKGEIYVLCSNGIKDAVEHLLPAAEKEIGRKINIEYSASNRL